MPTIQITAKDYERDLTKRLSNALMRVTEVIRDASIEIAPKDTEYMVDTAHIREVSDLEKVFAYTAPYSVYVHEDLEKAHGAAFNEKYEKLIGLGIERARGPNEQAKFLEKPIRDPLVQRRAVKAANAEMNK